MLRLRRLRETLVWAYRKNLLDLVWMARGGLFRALRKGDFSPWPQPPIFTFHSVSRTEFEEKLRFLVRNGYGTYAATDLLSGERKPNVRAVCLTFDDARLSLWTQAFPLLRQYGLRATVFVVPGCVEEDGDVQRDPQAGREVALCTWNHILAMVDSGFVDVQSHTNRHILVEVNPWPVGFLSPALLEREFGNTHLPLGARDLLLDRKAPGALGAPILPSRPLLTARKRVVLYPGIMRHCVEFVARNGGEAFFRSPHWEKVLEYEFRKALSETRRPYRLVSTKELARRELEEARLILEQRTGRRVNQLCLPWFSASRAFFQLFRATGYDAVYWGPQPATWRDQRVCGTIHFWRVDEAFLQCLPGDGRISVLEAVTLRFRKSAETWKNSRGRGGHERTREQTGGRVKEDHVARSIFQIV